MKVTMLGDGRARVETGGHVGEGTVLLTADGFTFDGEFTCGPHDVDGDHSTERSWSDMDAATAEADAARVLGLTAQDHPNRSTT